MKVKIGLSLCVLSAAGIVLLVMLRQERKGGDVSNPSDGMAREEIADLRINDQGRRVAVPGQTSSTPRLTDLVSPSLDARTLDPSQFSSAEDLLKQYWGDRWDAVKAEIDQAGLKLSKIEVAQIPVWSTARTQIQEAVASNVEQASLMDPASQADTQLNEEWTALIESEMDPAARVALASAQSEYEHRSRALAVNLKSKLVELRLNALDDPKRSTVHPIVFPHKTLKTPSLHPSDFAVCEAIMINGWSIYMLVPKADVAGFSDWWNELTAVQDDARRYLSQFKVHKQ
ncbi:MAG: hypothetical protein SGI72_12455 [Planctomycetota bacterium]|nr:hypothetical protein [Planctomycetota bacterium]